MLPSFFLILLGTIGRYVRYKEQILISLSCIYIYNIFDIPTISRAALVKDNATYTKAVAMSNIE